MAAAAAVWDRLKIDVPLNRTYDLAWMRRKMSPTIGMEAA